MEEFAQTISVILADNNIISNKDTAIYKYGIELLLTSVLEIASILVAAIFVGNFFETLIFLLSFLPVRIYSGGYHADTRIRCFAILISVYILFSFMLILDVSYIYQYLMIPFSTLTIICIYRWAPLEHNNKTIKFTKKIKFRNISLFLSSFESFIAMILVCFNIYNKWSEAFLLGLLTVLFSLVAGKIKNYLKGGYQNEKCL